MPARRSRRLPITRRCAGSGFFYLQGADVVRDEQLLQRIQDLAIPPAWREVEIATSPRAKLQARGLDAAGRTQAIYHRAFRDRQDQAKFQRMVHFGQALPGLRRQVLRDLRRGSTDQDRVTAALVLLLDAHLLRIGTHAYSHANGSFGAASLRRKHLSIQADRVSLDFPGKSGQQQQITIKSHLLAQVLLELRDEPGYELFRYLDQKGNSTLLRPSQVNEYLAEHLGHGFTAKDFRTWGGTLAAFKTLLDESAPTGTARADQAKVLRLHAIAQAAGQLGNTPAIAARSYIDPRVLQLAGEPKQLAALRRSRQQLKTKNHLDPTQRCLLRFLQRRSPE